MYGNGTQLNNLLVLLGKQSTVYFRIVT